MYPVLFTVFGHPVSGFGVMLALAFIAAIYTGKIFGKKIGESPDWVDQFSLYLIVVGVLGARFLYTFVEHGDVYLKDPIKFFYVWEGGYAFYGGLIACLFFVWIYCKRTNRSFLNIADMSVPSLALAMAIGRIGCFLMGCCHGGLCTMPWAVTYLNPESVAPLNRPVHPSQIYESAMAFGLFFLSLYLWKKRPFAGSVFLPFVILYVIFRSILEIFRGAPGHIIEDLSTAQFLSIPIAILCSGYFLYLRRNHQIQSS